MKKQEDLLERGYSLIEEKEIGLNHPKGWVRATQQTYRRDAPGYPHGQHRVVIEPQYDSAGYIIFQ